MCLGWEPEYLDIKSHAGTLRSLRLNTERPQEVQNREVIAVRDTAILVFVFKHVSCEIHMNWYHLMKHTPLSSTEKWPQQQQKIDEWCAVTTIKMGHPSCSCRWCYTLLSFVPHPTYWLALVFKTITHEIWLISSRIKCQLTVFFTYPMLNREKCKGSH